MTTSQGDQPTPEPAPMMQIGGILKDSLDAAAEAIVKVVASTGDPKVAIKALDTLSRLGETKGVTVSGCTFTNTPGGAMKSPPIFGSGVRMDGDRY